jgi:putative peptidoglycan lipid II flippase
MSLVKGVATVGSLTFVSRILGFARDIILAAVLGTGAVADAWAVAFRFPNLFRRLFGEGAFNAAFVPLYAGKRHDHGERSALRFAEDVLSVLSVALLVLTLVAEMTMPWIMQVYAIGFVDDPVKFDLTTEFTQIAFPYLIFISLVALYAGILNTSGKFAAAAGVQALLNVILMTALGIAWLVWRPQSDSAQWGVALVWGVAVAGVAQFLFLLYFAWRSRFSLRLRLPRLTPGVRHFVKLAWPGVVAGGVSQISLFIATVVASLQDGAPAILYYADRVYQFPLSIVGVALGIVLLPTLATHLRGDRVDLAQHWQNRGLEVAMLLTFPAAVALVVISFPIAATLFERGAFDRAATLQVANVLMAFGVGLPAFILNKVLTPAFFARHDTATPMRYAVIALVLDVALSVSLFFALGVIGIAIATSIAAWLNAGLLWITLSRRNHFTLDPRSRERIPRIALASLGMGALLFLAMQFLGSAFDGGDTSKALALAALCIGGFIAYAGLALLLRATTVSEMRAQLMGAEGLR